MDAREESGWLRVARTLAVEPGDPAALAWLRTAPALPEAPPPPVPAALVAQPAPATPAAWHASRLLALGQHEDSDRLERAWHARWLWYALAPEDSGARPRVSVIIPVFNRARLVAEAVESVLAQDYPAIEVVVVDDGSADDPARALARFGDRVVFHALPRNQGVSAARNVALSLATGELVHFLDSDDRLVPDALSAQMAALAAVPDALLCFSALTRCWKDRREDVFWPNRGTPICPTRSPVAGLVHRFPFIISSVLVARHQVARAGNFDPRLRQHEDRLLFQRFGLFGTKCVAIDRPLLIASVQPDSLAAAQDHLGYAALSALILLNDLLPHPDRWDLAGFVLQQCFWRHQWTLLNQDPHGYLAEESARLFAWLDDFIEGRRLPQLSPRPLAAEFAEVLRGREAEQDDGAFATPLRERLARMTQARPPGPADLALWRRSHNPPINHPALKEIFGALSAALRAGESWVPLASLDERPFRSFAHPKRRRWKRIAQTARLLGERPARPLGRLWG